MTENENETEWDYDLKPKDRLFCLQYCAVAETFLDATKSYRAVWTKTDSSGNRVVPDDITCQTNGSKKSKKLSENIKKLLKLVQAQLDEENAYRVLRDISSIALSSPADVLNDSGGLKCSLEELGEKAKCIAQIIPTKDGMRIVLEDRKKYMELLMKYLNLVRPETKVEVKLPVIEVTPKVTGENVLDAVERWNRIAEEES